MHSTSIEKVMIREATKARENAFAARSEHKVGAAVYISDGKMILTGCNIESNISGLGICAERNAINNAIIHGKYSYRYLLTYDDKPSIPCGACLQYIMEFQPLAREEIEIIAAGANGEILRYKISELLPKSYKARHGSQKLDPYRTICIGLDDHPEQSCGRPDCLYKA